MTQLSTHTRTLVLNEDHPLFAEHQPGNPCVPASLLAETMLKVAMEALKAHEAGGTHGVAVRNLPVLENFRFRRFVRPGRAECRAVVHEDHVGCEIWAGGRCACEGRIAWRRP